MHTIQQLDVLLLTTPVVQPHNHRHTLLLSIRETPATHPTQHVNRLRIRIQRQSHRLRHRRRQRTKWPIQQNDVRHGFAPRIRQQKWYILENLGRPVAEHHPVRTIVITAEQALRTHRRRITIQ